MNNLSVINALRGIAALSVMMFHFSSQEYGGSSLWEGFWDFGKLGVHMFFIISGFVIPLQLTRKNYQLKSFHRLLLNRFIRIYPLFLVVFVFAASVWYIQHRIFEVAPPDLSLANIVKNLTLSVKIFDGSFILGVTWTLTIEFFYYLFIGLTFPLIFSKKATIQGISILLFLMAFYIVPGSEKWNLFRWAPYFAIGFCTFNIKMKEHILMNQCLVVVALLMILIGNNVNWQYAPFLVSLFTTTLILLGPEIKSHAILFVGKISYSLYLIHHVLGDKAFNFTVRYFSDSNWAYPVAFVVSIASSILAAYILFWLIERPSHSYSKKVWLK